MPTFPARPARLALCLAAALAGCVGQAPATRGAARPPAAPAVAQGPRIALVVGNDDYPDLPLRRAVSDAQAVRDALAGLGFRVIFRGNADKAEMDRAMREFGAALRQSPGGVGLFYYAGHGGVANKTNYLWPAGASIQTEAELTQRGYEADIALGTCRAATNHPGSGASDGDADSLFRRGEPCGCRGAVSGVDCRRYHE